MKLKEKIKVAKMIVKYENKTDSRAVISGYMIYNSEVYIAYSDKATNHLTIFIPLHLKIYELSREIKNESAN